MYGGYNFEYDKISHSKKETDLRFYVVCSEKKDYNGLFSMLNGGC